MLTIRRAVHDDSTQLSSICADEEILWGYATPVMPTPEWWSERIRYTKSHGLLIVAEIDSQIVAFVELQTDPVDCVRRHSGILGVCVRKDARRYGVGRQILEKALDLADNWLAITRLELYVWKGHSVAIKLYQSLGFVQEGEHLCYGFRSGSYCDALSMARVIIRDARSSVR